MIAYEIQLRYLIRDKIRDKLQSETKFSLRKNLRNSKVTLKAFNKIVFHYN